MADRPRDDGPAPDDSFDDLDLGALSDGVRPTSGQWAEITDTAAHRRRRRAWLLSAAALVVLVLGTAAVVLGRDSSDRTVDIAAGGLGSDQFVIPPEDATDVNITSDAESYHLLYLHDGTPWQITVVAPGASGTDGTIPADAAAQASELSGGRAISTTNLGTVYTACAGWWITAGHAGTTSVPTFSGPPVINWMQGSRLARLMPAGGQDFSAACELTAGATADLELEVAQLRVVDAEEFQRYLAGDDGQPPVTPLLEETPVEPSPATTLPDDPPADRGSAEDQIRAAVESLTTVGEDQTFPYLEDGTTRAAEYRDMFDTAARQAGAPPPDGQPPTVFTLASVRFLTPERAQISMDMDTRLQSGTYQFSQGGEAILQDGRWVITYDTIARMLSRACTPPGGVSSECSGH